MWYLSILTAHITYNIGIYYYIQYIYEMALCYLCDANDRKTWCYYCEKCNNIKRMVALYGLDRVYEVLDCVLVRTKEQQNHKIKIELEKEKELATQKVEDAKMTTRSKDAKQRNC